MEFIETKEQQEITGRTDRLTKLKDKIELMDKSNHIEALYMISQNQSIKLTENNNGTFINLTDLDNNMIEKLEEFVQYVAKQNSDLNDIESKKDELENIYFKETK